MPAILKRIIFLELLAILWAAAMTAINAMFYDVHGNTRKIFIVCLVVSQLFVLLHMRRVKKT
jgi:hypothetical protein